MIKDRIVPILAGVIMGLVSVFAIGTVKATDVEQSAPENRMDEVTE